MSISNKAFLISLSISQWTGRKKDKRATSDVELKFKTKERVGQFTKKLLPTAKELDEISSVVNSARDYFNSQTLPWLSDGTRIVSSKNYLELTQELRKRAQDFDSAVSKFISAYDLLRVNAQNSLGDLFNSADYPSVNALKTSFSFKFVFLPAPDVNDFRSELLESEKRDFIDKMREVESSAIRDCYARLKGVVENAAKKLSQPDAIFRDTLISNIAEICQLLPKLNFADDPQLESMRKEVDLVVSKISPDTLRQSATARENAAKQLDEINARMGALMGGQS